jgi:hypothetical protein
MAAAAVLPLQLDTNSRHIGSPATFVTHDLTYAGQPSAAVTSLAPAMAVIGQRMRLNTHDGGGSSSSSSNSNGTMDDTGNSDGASQDRDDDCTCGTSGGADRLKAVETIQHFISLAESAGCGHGAVLAAAERLPGCRIALTQPTTAEIQQHITQHASQFYPNSTPLAVQLYCQQQGQFHTAEVGQRQQDAMVIDSQGMPAAQDDLEESEELVPGGVLTVSVGGAVHGRGAEGSSRRLAADMMFTHTTAAAVQASMLVTKVRPAGPRQRSRSTTLGALPDPDQQVTLAQLCDLAGMQLAEGELDLSRVSISPTVVVGRTKCQNLKSLVLACNRQQRKQQQEEQQRINAVTIPAMLEQFPAYGLNSSGVQQRLLLLADVQLLYGVLLSKKAPPSKFTESQLAHVLGRYVFKSMQQDLWCKYRIDFSCRMYWPSCSPFTLSPFAAIEDHEHKLKNQAQAAWSRALSKPVIAAVQQAAQRRSAVTRAAAEGPAEQTDDPDGQQQHPQQQQQQQQQDSLDLSEAMAAAVADQNANLFSRDAMVVTMLKMGASADVLDAILPPAVLSTVVSPADVQRTPAVEQWLTNEALAAALDQEGFQPCAVAVLATGRAYRAMTASHLSWEVRLHDLHDQRLMMLQLIQPYLQHPAITIPKRIAGIPSSSILVLLYSADSIIAMQTNTELRQMYPGLPAAMAPIQTLQNAAAGAVGELVPHTVHTPAVLQGLGSLLVAGAAGSSSSIAAAVATSSSIAAAAATSSSMTDAELVKIGAKHLQQAAFDSGVSDPHLLPLLLPAAREMVLRSVGTNRLETTNSVLKDRQSGQKPTVVELVQSLNKVEAVCMMRFDPQLQFHRPVNRDCTYVHHMHSSSNATYSRAGCSSAQQQQQQQASARVMPAVNEITTWAIDAMA